MPAESTVRYVKSVAALFKLNSAPTYGEDAAPTAAANAIQFNDVTVNPMAGSEVSRDLLLPYLGHQGVYLTGHHMTLQGSVELTGSGDPGTAPAFGPLLRACGMHEVIIADTSVVYNPISAEFEAGTIYYNLDGVKHVGLGARGTVSFNLAPLQIPRMTFNLMALSGTITDAALPTDVDLSDFIDAIPVSNAVTTMSLFGWSAIAESLAIDLGATVEPRFLIGEDSIKITDRKSTGTAVVQATSLATINWFDLSKTHTKGELVVQHGKVAGNIVDINAGAVQLGRLTQGATQNIANYSLPLMLTPESGNDEFTIGFR